MHEELRAAVRVANRRLGASGLVRGTFGNVSAIDRDAGVVVIKPSGVPYDQLTVEAISVVEVSSGKLLAGLRPSSDTATHLEIYRAFLHVGGVAHTHSPWATSFAQALRSIPCLGTTHADYFRGDVPVSRPLEPDEIVGDYEAATGRVIVETVAEPVAVPAVLVASHGSFTWGADADASVETAIALEDVARLAAQTLALTPGAQTIGQPLLDRHHSRKHGAGAYYGQPAS